MIGYKGMMFCKAWDSCKKGNDCPRAITPEVERQATKWWGGEDYPICVTEKMECYERK